MFYRSVGTFVWWFKGNNKNLRHNYEFREQVELNISRDGSLNNIGQLNMSWQVIITICFQFYHGKTTFFQVFLNWN